MRGPMVGKGVLIALVVASGMAGPVRAQNREKAWEVAPELGWISYGPPHLGDMESDRTFPAPTDQRVVEKVTSDIDDSASYAFRFGYHWTKKQMIEFGVSGTGTDGSFKLHKETFDTTLPPGTPPVVTNKQENVSVDMIVGHVNYVYNFFLHHRGKVVGFATGGMGLINVSMFGQTADTDMAPILDQLVGDENVFMYNYGIGIRFFGSEKAGLRIDARQVRYDSGARGQQDHIEIGFALTLIMGGA